MLNITNLVEYIEKNKNIVFNNQLEREEMKNFLKKYNYSNIFSLKYLVSTGRETKKINGLNKNIFKYEKEIYNKILKTQYLELLNLENKLRESVLMYEIELKSHFIFFLEKFFYDEKISFQDFLENLEEYNHKNKKFEKFDLKKIEKEWKREVVIYSEETHNNFSLYSHLLIKILSFGTLGKILDGHYKKEKIFKKFSNYIKKEKINFFIPKILRDLETIIILRNCLCHKESMIIFLEKEYKKNTKNKANDNKDYLNMRINAIEKIYQYYENQKLDSNSWIKKYSKFRISNGKNGNNFIELKINL